MSANNTADNTGSPLPSSPLRDQLTQEELESKLETYSSKIEEYLNNKTKNEKGKEKVSTSKRQKKICSHHERKLLGEMLEMEQCSIKGWVHGLVDEENKLVTGASDSLREWWKEQVMFDKAAPTEIEHYYIENTLSSNVAKDNEKKSTTKLLMELSDPTLGSILSLLVQHCDPLQKNYTYEKDPLPPWWSTGREDWWGQTGIPANEGPPPFKKPHKLRKKWKDAVIVGIIKLMYPHFSMVYNIKTQSQYLPLHMNAKEWRFWTLALVAEAMRYCQEHPDMPAGEAVVFLLDYGSRNSMIAPNIVKQNISVTGNEASHYGSSSGDMYSAILAPSSNTISPMQSTDIEALEISSGVFQDQHHTLSYTVSPVEQPTGGASNID